MHKNSDSLFTRFARFTLGSQDCNILVDHAICGPVGGKMGKEERRGWQILQRGDRLSSAQMNLGNEVKSKHLLTRASMGWCRPHEKMYWEIRHVGTFELGVNLSPTIPMPLLKIFNLVFGLSRLGSWISHDCEFAESLSFIFPQQQSSKGAVSINTIQSSVVLPD